MVVWCAVPPSSDSDVELVLRGGFTVVQALICKAPGGRKQPLELGFGAASNLKRDTNLTSKRLPRITSNVLWITSKLEVSARILLVMLGTCIR